MRKKIVAKLHGLWARQVMKRPSRFSFMGVEVDVPVGVFHPGLFFSTKLLASHLSNLDLSRKHFLELGCGTGFIAIVAAKKGAGATATDLNEKAIECAKANAQKNGVHIHVIQSDLFENINGRRFDIIVINPPYFKRQANSMQERAWFAGADFEYFRRLFAGLSSVLKPGCIVLMSASEQVEIEEIKSIAEQHGFSLKLLRKQKTLVEDHFIYQVQKRNNGDGHNI